MAVKKITIEGVAEFGGNEFVFVCGHCNAQRRDNTTIEFNFKEQKVFFYCPECKKMNEMFFGERKPPPYPRAKILR
jgi:NAD-dependent SIR2 family protein deacetylase